MNRLPEDLLPPLHELTEFFSHALGTPEAVTERDRSLLLAWEHSVRERVLSRSPSPTGAPHRWRLPDERQSMTHGFELMGEDGQPMKVYLTMGLFEDGKLGEVFCSVAKEGSFVSGIMDALSYSLSVALQHGVPLETFVKHFRYTKFQPSGIVRGTPKAIRGLASSVLDYIGKYLEYRFPNGCVPQEAQTPSASPAPAEGIEPPTP